MNGTQDPDNPIEVVNVFTTLLDENGNPATVGPNGEALEDVMATITSTLGNPLTGEIDTGQSITPKLPVIGLHFLWLS